MECGTGRECRWKRIRRGRGGMGWFPRTRARREPLCTAGAIWAANWTTPGQFYARHGVANLCVRENPVGPVAPGGLKMSRMA